MRFTKFNAYKIQIKVGKTEEKILKSDISWSISCGLNSNQMHPEVLSRNATSVSSGYLPDSNSA